MVCSPCSTSSGSSLPMSLERAITACARMIVSLSLSRSTRASRSSVYVSSLQKFHLKQSTEQELIEALLNLA